MEMVVIHLLHTHSRLRKADPSGGLPQLDCFTFSPKANLMKGSASAICISSGVHAPPEFDDATLAPNGVGRPVQNLTCSDPTSQVSIDIHVFAVDHRSDAHLSARGLGAFIDASAGRDVCVLIQNTGCQVLAFGIDPHQIRCILSKN